MIGTCIPRSSKIRLSGHEFIGFPNWVEATVAPQEYSCGLQVLWPGPQFSSARRLRLNWRLPEQRFEIQRPCKHCELASWRVRPHFFRAIPVQLDSVVVGVAQIESFADTVVGCALEG